MNLRDPDWRPRGVRKSWRRVSFSSSLASDVFQDVFRGAILEAAAWIDESDGVRVIVADTDRMRLTYRRNSKGYSIESSSL